MNKKNDMENKQTWPKYAGRMEMCKGCFWQCKRDTEFSCDSLDGCSFVNKYSAQGHETIIDLLIRIFTIAKRFGAEKDIPEGTRFIMISDTMAIELRDILVEFQQERINQ